MVQPKLHVCLGTIFNVTVTAGVTEGEPFVTQQQVM